MICEKYFKGWKILELLTKLIFVSPGSKRKGKKLLEIILKNHPLVSINWQKLLHFFLSSSWDEHKEEKEKFSTALTASNSISTTCSSNAHSYEYAKEKK